MRKIVRYVTVAIGVVALASSCDAAAYCRQYTQLLHYSGKLSVTEGKKIAEWTSGCEGAINASAAKGKLRLQTFQGGQWWTLKDGISTILPRSAPGRYRLIVTNPYGIPFPYEVNLRYGIR